MPIDPVFRYGRVLDEATLRLPAGIHTLPSIISWLRFEPLPHSADLAPGLEAQIADPLWLLARQWQFAEFAGEDAGSPISAELEGEQGRLSRYLPGAVPTGGGTATGAVDYTHLAMPLEVAVEREAVRATHKRLAVEAGENLLRLLRAAAVTDARAELRAAGFALDIADAKDADPRGEGWQALFAGRAVDGHKLAQALMPLRAADGTLGVLPDDLSFANTADASAAFEAWLRWYEQHVSEPSEDVGSAWLPRRQEYALALATGLDGLTPIVAADEYTDGRLDWYSFDAALAPTLGAPAEAAPSRKTKCTVLPTPVDYPGMPADRFWEFEDGRVNFGRMEAGPTDITRMLLVEYALVYGNDWFVIPVEMDVGSMFRVKSLVVHDTFGVATKVNASRNLDGTRWTMFTLSSKSREVADLFFLPPTLPYRLESAPLEQVAFFRDEMANMVWAVERSVQGAAGEARDRRMEPPMATVHQRITADQVDAELIYRLATPVPLHWMPFVPVPDDPTRPQSGVHLERRVLLRTLEDGSQVEVHPEGLLLRSDTSMPVEDEPPLYLYEEEIPRAGAVVTRSFQFARWTDGQRLLWVGRSKRAGQGEGASGLRYDIALYRDREYS